MRIEAKIRTAVAVLLAGCTPAESPPTPIESSGPRLDPSAPLRGDASAPLRGDASTPDAGIVAIAEAPPTATVPIDAGPALNVAALCAAYAQRASTEPKGPKVQTPYREITSSVPPPTEASGSVLRAHVSGGPGAVVCQIFWGTTEATRSVAIPVRCCPPFHGPCVQPPPSTQSGKRARFETVQLDAKGDRVTNSVETHVFFPEIPEPPYCGRRPEGWAPNRHDGATLGDQLAAMAELEAAAVHAFRRLEQELEALGAPDALVRRASQAARDEARHALSVARLARRHGGVARFSRRPRFEARDRLAIAVENAVEGCVHETYGAALALYQSGTARRSDVRALFASLAEDELAHARLSWDVADWLASVSSPPENDVVARARADAERRLIADETLRSAVPSLGRPDGATSARLATDLFA